MTVWQWRAFLLCSLQEWVGVSTRYPKQNQVPVVIAPKSQGEVGLAGAREAKGWFTEGSVFFRATGG